VATPSTRVTHAPALDPEFRESYFGNAGAGAALAPELYAGTLRRLSWFLEIPRQRGFGLRTLERGLLRALDILLGLTALLLLAPLLLVLALVIKLDSPGPVIFRQWRVGMGQRHFRMLKLRTMAHESSPDGLSLTREKDPRVTRVGSFLRRHHVDEIPQFWNVVLGDMSIVGPRPEVPELAEVNRDNIRGYDDRMAVRPGITGLAQITNGYDSSLDELRSTVALDRHYIRHLCLGNYLMVLLRTVPVVLFSRGGI